MADPDDGETIPRRRELVAMALGWPAFLLATGSARAGEAAPTRAVHADPLPLTVEGRVYLAVSRSPGRASPRVRAGVSSASGARATSATRSRSWSR